MTKLQIIVILLCLIIILLTIIFPYLTKLGIGGLPGDILVKKKNFTFFFPITACLVISCIVSLILWFIKNEFS